MTAGLPHAAIAALGRQLAAARRVLFITGAGLSADSGLPTYRGVGGLYQDAGTDEGLPIETALSGDMLRTRPANCWKYIHQIELACRGHRPNRAHEVIATLERELPQVVVLTQNVDGFHRAAGSKNVIEIHGDIHRLICTACRRREQVVDYAGLSIPPSCPACDGLVRPEVVLFGEMLPEAALAALRQELRNGFDLVFSVGTTSLFPYIVEPVLLARSAGHTTVEINPGTTVISAIVDTKIEAGAAVALEAMFQAYRAARSAAPVEPA